MSLGKLDKDVAKICLGNLFSSMWYYLVYRIEAFLPKVKICKQMLKALDGIMPSQSLALENRARVISLCSGQIK